MAGYGTVGYRVRCSMAGYDRVGHCVVGYGAV